MVPHSYTLDSLSKSQDIASTIASASSPPQILSTCASIQSFLHSHTPDHSRHFFSIAFPTLICKLFGFDDPTHNTTTPNPPRPDTPSPVGWIDAAISSNDSDLAAAISSLLSPSGTLAAAISAVDRLSLVKYVFPAERLPEWARFLLLSSTTAVDSTGGGGPRALSELCPSLFKSRVRESLSQSQIQLNVFEYFFFWFAYYPVCRGKSDNSDNVTVKRTVKKFRLVENWTSSISRFSSNSKRGSSTEQKNECNLYIRILYAYLREYVPTYDLNAHQPYRSSILHYGSGFDAEVVARAEFIVNALIHFWLVDNDFSPFPVNACKSLGVSFRLRSVLGETPPTPGLGDVIKVFVRYLNLSTVALFEARENGGGECNGSPRWRNSGSSLDSVKGKELVSKYNSARCWNPWVQRPLYRFLLRTFLFCPVASSVKNVSQVFSVWIGYLEPWNMTGDEFLELDALTNGSGSGNAKRENSITGSGAGAGYSARWQDYVLSNYLYYSSLVMHFIGFAHRFLHNDVEVIVQMVLKVLDTLASSKELIDLLKNVDTLFHSKQAGSGKSMLNNFYRYVPIIREQLQDWEDGLCETDADGSFLHENWNKDLRLFADGEDGGQQLLQLFIMRAEAELQAMSGDCNTPSLQCIDSLKARLGCLFDGHIMNPSPTSPEQMHQQCRDDIFKPRRAGNHAFVDVKYKGDWMRRPISNDEIAWLAKVLIRLSDWLNESLGLNNQAESSSQVSPAYVEVSTDVAHICGPSDAVKVILWTIGSWFLFIGAGCLGLMRRYGLRVNLRVLASKKFVMALVLYASFCILKKIIRPLLSN